MHLLEGDKRNKGGHLFSAEVPIATDSNCEGSIQKIISKMDHHTLIRGASLEERGTHEVREPITRAVVVPNITRRIFP
jgi:hypothetical protein